MDDPLGSPRVAPLKNLRKKKVFALGRNSGTKKRIEEKKQRSGSLFLPQSASIYGVWKEGLQI